MSSSLVRAVALAFALSMPAFVCAAPITFSYAGSIDNDPFGVFGNATFTGSYTFDSAMTQVLSTPSSGGYAGSAGLFSMQVAFTGTSDPALEGATFTGDSLNITVNNDFPGPLDQYLVTGTSTTHSNLLIELTFDDNTGTAFSNTLLPLTAPNVASFFSPRFALFAGTLDNPLEAEGVVDSLRCTAGCRTNTVPEPSTLALVAALLIAGRTARPRKRSNSK